MPTPVPNATPTQRPSMLQALSVAIAQELTPLAPGMEKSFQETGATAQLARWELGMKLLQKDDEVEVNPLTLGLISVWQPWLDAEALHRRSHHK